MESLVKKRTRHFYAWERRGRGWQRRPFTVALEPPFTPFRYLSELAPALDDGRHPSLLERWFGGRGPIDEAAEVADEPAEPEADPHDYPSDLVELRLLPNEVAAEGPAITQAWLRSVGGLEAPASLELLGSAGRVALLAGCRVDDAPYLVSQASAFFPDVNLQEAPEALVKAWEGAGDGVFGAIEFGLEREFVLPLSPLRSLSPDPLTSICAALGQARVDELGILQVLFQGASAPWAESAARSVITPSGEPFFEDAPEVTSLAREKLSGPLFAVVVRAVALAGTNERVWALLRAIAHTVTSATAGANTLVPLGQDDVHDLLGDVLSRTTHRSGMLLSAAELSTLIHVPAATVPGIVRGDDRTKAPPDEEEVSGVALGYNRHRGEIRAVRLSDDARARHVHVVGAPGTGKSTLLLSMILQDIRAGHGVGVVDPHGDLIDEVLARVPAERADDVVLFDPSDPEYAVGWNMLSASSDAEKEMLASDLVAAFRRLSTSWGDQMTAVLGNAVAAFLESDHGGTLIDLRRFLTERQFREGVLAGVRDPHAREFWTGHFPLLSGKPQASILTRLDTLLRSRLVRGVVTATDRPLDFRRAVDDGRILLARLSQGAIGEENAALLGSLLVSRIHQVCLLRQDTPLAERRPFFLYVDEFHHVATPSMAALFSGARKYRLGVTVAHQDLYQLHAVAPDVERAVLANAHTRICFRVGEDDARTLSRGLSFFTADDLLNLGTGEAVGRIGRRENDFNLTTIELESVPPDEGQTRRRDLRLHSLPRWGSRREPDRSADAVRGEEERVGRDDSTPKAVAPEAAPARASPTPPPLIDPPAPVRSAEALQEPRRPGKGGPEHTYLQELIKRWAEERGFRAAVEEQIEGGRASVDVALYRGDRKIACEITVSTPLEYEVGNVAKCLAAGFGDVAVISLKKRRLEHIDQLLSAALSAAERERVHLFTPEELVAWLSGQPVEEQEGVVGGYRVRVRRGEAKNAQSERIAEIVARSLRRLSKEDT